MLVEEKSSDMLSRTSLLRAPLLLTNLPAVSRVEQSSEIEIGIDPKGDRDNPARAIVTLHGRDD